MGTSWSCRCRNLPPLKAACRCAEPLRGHDRYWVPMQACRYPRQRLPPGPPSHKPLHTSPAPGCCPTQGSACTAGGGTHLVHHQALQLRHLAAHLPKRAQRAGQPPSQRLCLRLQLGHAAVQRGGASARQVVHLRGMAGWVARKRGLGWLDGWKEDGAEERRGATTRAVEHIDIYPTSAPPLHNASVEPLAPLPPPAPAGAPGRPAAPPGAAPRRAPPGRPSPPPPARAARTPPASPPQSPCMCRRGALAPPA